MRQLAFVTASLLIATPAAAKPTLVVAPLQSTTRDKDNADTLGEMIRIQVGKSDRYTLVTPEDMGAIDEELKRQLSGGCDEASCIAEMGGALGAQFMITGKFKRMGKRFILLLKLVDIEKVKAINTQSVMAGSPEVLLDLLGSKIAQLLGAQVLSVQTPRLSNPAIQGGEITPELGWLSITGKPAGASVTITGPSGYQRSLKLRKDKPWMEQVPPGSYQLSASLLGYETERDTIRVNTDATTAANIALQRPGRLVITGTPEGARLAISGPNDFSTVQGLPTTIDNAQRGQYVIEASRSGYQPQRFVMMVEANKPSQLEFNLLRAKNTIEATKEANLFYLRAAALVRKKRYAEALQESSRALSIDARNPKYLVQKATILDRLKRYDEAANLMRRAIRLMPEKGDFYVQLALILLKSERVAEARVYLVTAAGIDSENSNIHYLLGVTFVEKQPDKAIGYLREADLLRPKHGPTLLSMGEAFYRSNRLLDAINALTESIQADSASVEAREWRARAYRDQGQYPEALVDLDQALDVRGANAGLYYDKAEVYRRWGIKLHSKQWSKRHYPEQIVDAERWYRKATKLNPSWGKPYCRIAELKIFRRRFRQASLAASRCVQYEPYSGSGHLSVGIIQKESRNYDQAEKALRRSLQVDPRGEFSEEAQAELDALLRYR